MTIEVLYSPDCPNYLPAVQRVKEALLEEQVLAEIRHVEVLDAGMAAGLVFLGSPSIRVNGVDVESPARSNGVVGLCCRIYVGRNGREGAPSIELIREAIRQAISAKDIAVPKNDTQGS